MSKKMKALRESRGWKNSAVGHMVSCRFQSSSMTTSRMVEHCANPEGEANDNPGRGLRERVVNLATQLKCCVIDHKTWNNVSAAITRKKRSRSSSRSRPRSITPPNGLVPVIGPDIYKITPCNTSHTTPLEFLGLH